MNYQEFSDIPQYNTWKSIEFIDKGWSLDKKYKVINKDNSEFVLRISDISRYDLKLKEYKIVQQFYTTGIDMCQPIAFGKCNQGKQSYMLLTWVNGEQAELVLPTLNNDLQYNLGYKAGQMLRKLHSINELDVNSSWKDSYTVKHQNRILMFNECGIKNNKVDKMIEYCKNNISLLEDTVQCQTHGDFHVGNLIIDSNNKISVIDFSGVRMADPYYEFNRISISSNISKDFASGQINGYFNNVVPKSFFKFMMFYRTSILIGTIPWSLKFEDEDLEFSLKTINNTYEDYNSLQSNVPSWYIKPKNII